ncbi:Cellulose synthase like G2 [Hibiscus syriacus]|uniref:Cellulose synthase like G2 n=1 Tax=Hibiscus syriacus TaxID=106335 RepID=A0A6A2X5R6_HIBSY|nr:Cellulose synthase like G2 [Hibiscus syriacus]
MEKSLPLHLLHANSLTIIINRSHLILHFIAILLLIHYRLSFFFQHPTLPWLLIFVSELLLSLSWLLWQSTRWRPVYRTVFPERLPPNDELPAIDVFICTADPNKEPTVEVMNTVISAVAMDYPPEKLHVYVSDDAGSDATLRCVKEAWNFATYWVPFCRKYGIDTGCPEIYFLNSRVEDYELKDSEFKQDDGKMKQKYEVLKQRLKTIVQHRDVALSTNARDHPSIIEVINEHPKEEMPLLVYVSREKRPSHHHSFKAGALNVLLRVSAMMSNSPYILVLDCDMYCSDPTSARQAMCFYCDPQTSPSLAFVQFPQMFRNICGDDIYDGEIRATFKIYWPGLDGVGGPIIAGTNFYMKREALLGNFSKQGFTLHRKGWKSVYLYPKRPQFLGTSTTNLNEMSIQWTRWMSGLASVGISRFCPLIYGPLNMSLVHLMGYSALALEPLLQCISLWGFALIPQLCLFNGIPLYPKVKYWHLIQFFRGDNVDEPLFVGVTERSLRVRMGWSLQFKVSDPSFYIFSTIFVSSISKSLYETVVTTGGEFRTWRNEWRLWMMKSVTCATYGSLDAVLNKLGMKDASFLPTNKVTDDEQVKLYEKGVFDFRAATMFVAPLVTVILVNTAALVRAFVKALVVADGYWEQMVGQMFLSFYILVSNYAVIEGMVIRGDKASIPLSVTLLSAVFSVFIMFIGSAMLC